MPNFFVETLDHTWEGALPLVQLLIDFKLSCWEKEKEFFSKQLIKKLIDQCQSVCESELYAQFIPIPKPKTSKIGWLVN